MSDEILKGREQARFPALLVFGLLGLGVIAVVAGIALGGEFVIPVLILAALCAIVAIGYRTLAGNNRASRGGEARDVGTQDLPAQPANDSRPLGDTPEAHDEISPHDLPKGHPGRAEAERQAAEGGGTTRGDV